MTRFTEHYQILGIQPGDSWPKARIAYKAKMKRWHPDRFAQSTEAGRHAEEMTKRVNQAYQEILGYFEEHGRMPLDKPPPAEIMPKAGPEPDASTPFHDVRREKQEFPAGKNALASRSSRFVTMMILALLVSVFWFIDPSPDSPQQAADSAHHRNPADDGSARITTPATPAANGEAAVAAGKFGIGSTLGEVYTIQGVPSRTEGGVWYYGSAFVAFSNGRVTRWVDTDPPILRADSRSPAQADEHVTAAPGFSRGSTREEVRAIQGNPMRESPGVWDYGQSQVRFDRDGRVSGWTESPYNPLRINRQ